MSKKAGKVVGLFDKVGYKTYMLEACVYVGLIHGILYLVGLAYVRKYGSETGVLRWLGLLLCCSYIVCMMSFNGVVRSRCRHSREVVMPLSSGSYLISRLVSKGDFDREVYNTCRSLYDNLGVLRSSGATYLVNIQALVCYLSSLQLDYESNLDVDYGKFNAFNDKMCTLEYIVIFGRVFVLGYSV